MLIIRRYWRGLAAISAVWYVLSMAIIVTRFQRSKVHLRLRGISLWHLLVRRRRPRHEQLNGAHYGVWMERCHQVSSRSDSYPSVNLVL